MDFSPPAILPPKASETLLNAVSSATSSSITTIGLYQNLTLQVTGSNWRSEIVVEGRIGGLDWVVLPVTGPLGLPQQKIVTNGIYYINVAGMTTFRVRTTTFAGAGTVTATGVLTMSFAPRVQHRRVNNRVAQAYQQTIAAGAQTTIFNGTDVSGYPFLFFGLRGKDSEIDNIWQVQLKWAPVYNRDLGGSAGNGSPESFITVIDTTAGRGSTDWIPNRAELAVVAIKNLDTVDHIFDVFIGGIH